MSKPMHWTYTQRTCIGVYPAQKSKLYSAQMSRPISCPDVYIMRRYLGCILHLYLSLLLKCLSCVDLDPYYAQISKPLPRPDIWVYIIRRFLSLYTHISKHISGADVLDLFMRRCLRSILCAGV